MSEVGLELDSVELPQYLGLMTTMQGPSVHYQKDDMEEGAPSVLKSMKEMMKMLILDHQKREDEFAEEWKQLEQEQETGREVRSRKRSRDAVKHNVFTFGEPGKAGEVTQKTGAEAVGKTSSKKLYAKLSLKRMMWRPT